jgi:type 1 glutamine amidotransferase
VVLGRPESGNGARAAKSAVGGCAKERDGSSALRFGLRICFPNELAQGKIQLRKTNMKLNYLPILPLLLCAALLGGNAAGAEKIRVLLVTGGHAYETNQFNQMFADNPDITFQAVAHPKAQALFKPDAARSYDVIVLYDMWPKITDDAKADFVARIKEGKGLVALHHCLGSYQDWPEYKRIIGGKYLLQKEEVDGVALPGSTYKHDVKFKVRVEPVAHPVTRGLKDFEIHDETYGGLSVNKDVTPLLTTDEPTSAKTVAWAKTYAGTRVATLQLGHDHLAWDNPNFRKLLSQAIAWTANRN